MVMVRLSCGCNNHRRDIDRLIDMLKQVAEGHYRGEYRLDRATGDDLPATQSR